MHIAEYLGLVAYLSVMYGRLPDRELLSAIYPESKPSPSAQREVSRPTAVRVD